MIVLDPKQLKGVSIIEIKFNLLAYFIPFLYGNDFESLTNQNVLYAKKWFMSSRRKTAFNEISKCFGLYIYFKKIRATKCKYGRKKTWNTGLKMRECLCVLNHFLKSLASKVVMNGMFAETFIFFSF